MAFSHLFCVAHFLDNTSGEIKCLLRSRPVSFRLARAIRKIHSAAQNIAAAQRILLMRWRFTHTREEIEKCMRASIFYLLSGMAKLLNDILIHKYEVAEASAHHKQMENFVGTEVFVAVVEDGEL